MLNSCDALLNVFKPYDFMFTVFFNLKLTNYSLQYFVIYEFH